MRSICRELTNQAIVLALLLAIAFPGFFFQGKVLSPADILFQSKPWKSYAPKDWKGPSNRLMPDVVTAFYPYYSITKSELDAGRWPLWNRYELAGMPLMANAQTAIFYPPRLLHRAFDVPTANSIFILLKLWLCGMTAFICALGLRMGPAAARFASIAWMLCGYNVAWAYWSLPDVAAWLPILFLGTERILENRNRQGATLVATAGALLLFAGHPETAFTMAFGVGVYFVLRIAANASQPMAVARAILAMGCGWLVALLVASVQVIPLLEYLAHSSTFTERHLAQIQPVLPLRMLVAIWAPRFYGVGAEQTYWGPETLNSNVSFMLYTGLPVWAMVWLGGAPLRERKGRAAYWSLAGASLFCMLLALNLNELSWLLSLPPFGSTVKFYFAAFPAFALIMLGSRGLNVWLESRRGIPALAPLLGAVLVPAVYFYCVTAFESTYIAMAGLTPLIHREVESVALLAAATASACVVSCYSRFARVFPYLIAVVLAADLLVSARGLNPTMRKSDVFPDTQITKFLQGMPVPCRIGIEKGGIPSGLFSPYAIEECLGYDGLYPGRIITFQTKLGKSIWNAAEPLVSNQYYLNDPSYPPLLPLDERPDQFELVTEIDGIQIYKNTKALPRARLVGTLREFENDKDLFEAMRSDDFDPEHEAYALKEDLPRPAPAGGVNAVQGSASITAYTSTMVVIDVRAETDTILTLSDAYFPGWQMTIDGVRTPHFPVYHAFRGAFVPKGRHTVVYEYWPRSFQVGLGLSTLTLLALAIAAIRLLAQRKPGPAN